ncbi:MAG TPA: Ig-like domain repeat protein [Candidatus Angelobacter sp.]|nr:Ig-like domain repeat protein [Candidatus Angelobacter sp.]
MPSLRGLSGVARVLLFLLLPVAWSFSQSPSQAAANAPAAQAQAGSAGAVSEDDDSADIPPFARGHISEKEYFELRDQAVRLRRGIDDLMRTPQARSLAVRKMQLQEQVLRFAVQGINPFGSLLPALSPPAWTPLGPDPIPNGQTTGTEVAVSGRVTAIVVSPVTDQTVYVGTAQGGVYRSLDGGTTWTALLDSAQSLAIGALALDPQNSDTLFVGTGEGNLSGDSFFGVGLYMIRNASTASPVVTGPFNTDGTNDLFTGRAITQILVNPADDAKILVSTASGVSGLSQDSFGTLPDRGVFLSTNAQSATPTFTRVTVQTGTATGMQNRTVTDMVMDPGDPSKILVYVFGTAVAGDGGVWVSTAGDPWAGTATWTQTITRQGFGKFAVNRSGTPAVTTFAVAQDETVACGATSTQGSLRTSADGVTWSAQITAANGFCGGQCFYDMVPAFHPTTASTIYLGGSADGSCSKTLAKSINGGTTFNSIDNELHADFHALAFAPTNANEIYAGNDGGIFRSVDAGATWSSINTAGFNATQFVSLSLHPTDPNFTLGGTQDNGTEFMNPAGTWTRADAGDGGYSAIDQSSTDTTNVTMYHTYFNQRNNLIAYARASSAANLNENTSWTVFGCPAQAGLALNGFTCTDSVLFYPPLALGPGVPNTFYFGTDHLYRSVDSGTTMTPVSQTFGCCEPNTTNNFRVSAIGISPQDDNVRLLGLTTGRVFATTTGANSMTDVTGGWAAKFISRTVIDPNNKTTAYVVLDGYGTPGSGISHIFKTEGLAGEPPAPIWVASSNGIPDVPVNAFAVDPLNSSYLYAGTDIGVFSSIDGGANWAAYGSGLPRVAVFDLNIQKTSHKVRIGTHGRGAWEIAASLFTNTTSVAADLITPTLGQNVIFTASVDKGAGVNVPTGTVTFLDGTTVLGTGAVDGSGNATFQTTTLTAGPHNITASYGGDTLYLSSTSAALAITVITPGGTPTTTALSSNITSVIFGNPVLLSASVAHASGAAAPTGTVTFDDGVVSIGSASVNAQGNAGISSNLGVGSHNITAIYGGDSTYAPSTSTVVAVVVRGSTILGLSVSSTAPTVGTTVTFTATLTTTGSQSVPTGQVTFKDGAATLGQSAFLDSTVATFQTATLAVGPHTITAEYSGDATFVGSTSSAVTVTVATAAPDYQISIPNGSATIAAGQSAAYNISITPQGGFNGTISFACSGLPAASSCSFNPATLTPSGSATSTTLTIATTARTTASARTVNGTTMAALTGIGFLGIVFLGVPTRRRRSLHLAGMLLLAFGMAMGIASCGGSSQPPITVPGTPPGTFSVTVTATSGTTTHSSVITLKVQ